MIQPFFIRLLRREETAESAHARGLLSGWERAVKAAAAIDQALAILCRMDDEITDGGGDSDKHGRRQLAKIRRAKTHLRRAAVHSLHSLRE